MRTSGDIRRSWHDCERGQALILGVFALIITFGFVAMSIDVGLFLRERRDVQNAVDAAALSGAQELPNNPAKADSIARQWAAQNEHSTPFASLTTGFRSVVGDRNDDGLPDAGDVPAVCNPGPSVAFKCSGSLCVSPCDSSLPTNKCNTIIVAAKNDVPFAFAPVLSIIDSSSRCVFKACSTGVISGVACRGSCGASPSSPLDLVLIIDRTSSMSVADLDEAKSAARSALSIMNPEVQHIGLAVLSKARPGDKCNSVYNNTDPGRMGHRGFQLGLPERERVP